MKYQIFSTLLACSLLSPSVVDAKLCERVGLYAEVLTFSEHLGDDFEPAGGYNEENPGLSLGGVCKNHFTHFDLNASAGAIVFKNSYDDTSTGITLGLNLSTPVYGQWDVFGGTNIAIVDGYEDLDDSVRIGDEIAILPAIAAGVSYNLTNNISLRGTANIVPSVGDADGVFLPTFGIQYLY